MSMGYKAIFHPNHQRTNVAMSCNQSAKDDLLDVLCGHTCT